MTDKSLAEPRAERSALAIEIQTFSKSEDRRRLSPVALTAFRAIAQQWGLSKRDAAELLGVSEVTWDRVERGAWKQALSQDQLTRASAIIGVYKGLHTLFADTMADRWPKLPNRGPLFQGISPVNAMIEGGIPMVLKTRRYVDALSEGI